MVSHAEGMISVKVATVSLIPPLKSYNQPIPALIKALLQSVIFLSTTNNTTKMKTYCLQWAEISVLTVNVIGLLIAKMAQIAFYYLTEQLLLFVPTHTVTVIRPNNMLLQRTIRLDNLPKYPQRIDATTSTVLKIISAKLPNAGMLPSAEVPSAMKPRYTMSLMRTQVR